MTYDHLQADCLYTGISCGPNARCRVWEAFTFFKHIIGHIGDGFYGSNDPTNSVKALKGSSGSKDQASIPPGPPHHVTILHMHATYSQTQNNAYTKMNLSTVKWAQ